MPRNLYRMGRILQLIMVYIVLSCNLENNFNINKKYVSTFYNLQIFTYELNLNAKYFFLLFRCFVYTNTAVEPNKEQKILHGMCITYWRVCFWWRYLTSNHCSSTNTSSQRFVAVRRFRTVYRLGYI